MDAARMFAAVDMSVSDALITAWRAKLRADVVDARVWLGIHFRFADVAARNMGVSLASWALHHYFQPVKRHR